MKKGFVFTMDVLVGMGLLVLSLLAFIQWRYETTLPERGYEKLGFFADDAMELLTHLKVDDVKDSPTIGELISKGVVKDLNKTVLDLIASFWYAGNETVAGNISEEILKNITEGLCTSILIENETIYSSCETSGKDIAVSSMIETGYEVGRPTHGYTARAFLTSIRRKITSSYAYFGGYVGDGNVSRNLTLYGMDTVLNATIEMDAGSDFDLYINGDFSGSYSPTAANLTADEWVINPSYLSYFNPGENTVFFSFTGNRSFIAGGYIKVTYNTTQLAPEEEVGTERYWFPGIYGIINLYSSFYVPGTLTSMGARLHYLNTLSFEDYNIPVYVVIGNKTVFRSNATGEQIIDLSYTNISDKFGGETSLVNSVSNKTVPIRFGTETFLLLPGRGTADAVLITDVSGSMNGCDVKSPDGPYNCTCFTPSYTGYCLNRLFVAKEVDRDFVEGVLEIPRNRVGLVSYSTSTESTHPLSEDKSSLIDEIDSYYWSDWTCTSCGIASGTDMLINSPVDKNFISEKRSWLYETSFPTGDPPLDLNGNSWKETDYNDSGWRTGYAILGFEDPAYAYSPNVDTDIGNNFVSTTESYNASNYLLIKGSITGGSLSDTYAIDESTFDVLQEEPALTEKKSAQTKICSCSVGGCYCDISFNDFLDGDCTLDTASINVRVKGDLNSGSEYVTVYTDGTGLGNCCMGNCGQCLTDYSDCASYDVTAYADDNSLTVRCDASSGVNSCSPYMDCQVNLTLTENCQKVNGEVRFNSSTISYHELPSSIKARIKFLSNETGNYQAMIYNFNTNDWESAGCDGGAVEGNVWNDYWCNKTLDVENYISDVNRTTIALSGSSTSRAVMKIDFIQYHTTIGNGNYYFRKHFNVENVSAINSARLYVLSDDRAEVYLNGYLIDNDTEEHNATHWNRPVVIFSDGFEDYYDGSGSHRLYDTEINRAPGFWIVDGAPSWDKEVFLMCDNSNYPAYGGTDVLVFRDMDSYGYAETTLDLSGYSNPRLSYWWRLGPNAFDGGEYGDVRVWDGSWHTVATYDYDDDDNTYHFAEIDISSYNMINGFKIRFGCRSSRSDERFCVDDVIVEASSSVDTSYFTDGNNIIAVKLYNDDDESAKFDLKLVANIDESRKRAMLVMSDGYTNTLISGDYSPDMAKVESIEKACEARDDYNITVYSVAFGLSADRTTLKKIACWNCSACYPSADPNNPNCWLQGESYDVCSRFYESDNAEELKEIYRKIAEEITELGYEAQILDITGAVTMDNILYPDSYIEFNYTPIVIPYEYGEISLTRETNKLKEFSGDDIDIPCKEGWYNISEDAKVVDAKITSFSSEFWTDRLNVSGPNGDWTSVYSLGDYGSDYHLLGDPYTVQIPVDLIEAGNNSVCIGTGTGPTNATGGSPDNRVIYTMRIKGSVGYGDVFNSSELAVNDSIQRVIDKVGIYVDVEADDIETLNETVKGIQWLWGPSLIKILVWENTTV